MYGKFLPHILIMLSIVSVWSIDRHAQYKAGVVACEQRWAQEALERLPEAIEKADKTRAEVEKAKDEHEVFKEYISSLPPTGSDGFSDDELWVFNKAIEAANARSSGGPREVREPSLSN